MQKGKPFACTYRAMAAAERIEKEIRQYALPPKRKFYQCVYVYEKSAVSVQTDHSPLESISKKPLCKAPPPPETSLMLRLQPYDRDVHYVPGTCMCLANIYMQSEGNDELKD